MDMQKKQTVLLNAIKMVQDHPVLYTGKQIHIVYFGIFSALNAMSIMTAFFYYLYIHGFSVSASSYYMLPIGGLMVWAGARLMHLMALGKKFFNNPAKYLFETGFYFQGGIVGAILWSILYGSVADIPLSFIWDGLCFGTLLGQFFGRIGCFNYGCCYGKTTTSRWGIAYTNLQSKILRLHPELKGVRVHPVQLYKSGMNLFAFSVILWLVPYHLPNGVITIAFLIYHGLTRIVMECFRADIYFNQKRNRITYYFSILAIVSAIPLFVFGKAADSFFLKRSSLSEPHSLLSLKQLMIHTPYFTEIILFIGAIVFLGYGIHGKTLGRFPFPERGRHEDKSHDHRSRSLRG
jgi:prolipoprotein diacylglyceryltransferase